MLKIGTACSGIGAPEQALKNLGIDHSVEFAIEIDKYARQTYLANHDTKLMLDDITKVDADSLPDIDMFVAGFPCQAFSIAGKRLGLQDTRGTIFFDCLRILQAKRPKYFILENVKGLLSDQGGATFETIVNSLAKTVNGQLLMFPNDDSLNYHLYYKVINAKDHGIPQNRERIFLIGFRDDKHNFNFPGQQKLKLKLKDMLDDNIDSKYYLSKSQFKALTSYINNDVAATLQTPGHSCGNYKGMNIINEVGLKKLNSDNRQGYAVNSITGVAATQTSKGGGLGKSTGLYQVTEPMPCITPTRANKRQNGPRFKKPGSDSKTITTQDQPGIYYQDKIRRLTPTECLKLMGFHHDYKMPVSDTQKYKQAGNSIVVQVLQALLRQILNEAS